MPPLHPSGDSRPVFTARAVGRRGGERNWCYFIAELERERNCGWRPPRSDPSHLKTLREAPLSSVPGSLGPESVVVRPSRFLRAPSRTVPHCPWVCPHTPFRRYQTDSHSHPEPGHCHLRETPSTDCRDAGSSSIPHRSHPFPSNACGRNTEPL